MNIFILTIFYQLLWFLIKKAKGININENLIKLLRVSVNHLGFQHQFDKFNLFFD